MKQFNFNNGWLFCRHGGETVAQTVTLPHDAQLGETRSAELTMDSGYFPGGKYRYIKKYFCPVDSETVLLEFDGVYQTAEVLINGQTASYQPGGYTNFLVPLHEYLKPGESNTIEVIADNSLFPNARWYTGAGIYRNVVLHSAGQAYIPPYGIKIDTLDYKSGQIAVRIDAAHAKGCTAEISILHNGQEVVKATGFDTEITIPDVQLWSAEHPNLYTALITLLKDGQPVDRAEQRFGVRHIAWHASFGLKINGETVLLRGGCIHHDNGILGAAAHSEAEERKVRLLKEAGFNALRSSHNLCSKAMLRACDEYGVYMMDEFADMWIQHKHKHDYATYFRDWHEADLKSMVAKDYNHPSVILYSIGNEVGESATPEGVEYAKKMTALLHSLDDSRPVTCGINLLLNGLVSMGKGLYQGDGMVMDTKPDPSKEKTSGSTFVNGIINRMGAVLNFVGRLKKFDLATRDVFAVLDIAGYNYGSGRYSLDPKKYPDRITVGSETFPPYLYKNWQAVKKHPNLIGDFMWTAWDYLGEAGLSVATYGDGQAMLKEYPALLSGAGIIEITGEFRPEVYWARNVWGIDTKPYLAVEPLTHADEKVSYGMWRSTDARHSWAWPGYEGKKTTVKVYTSAKTVKLFLQDVCIGTQRVKECTAVFKGVEYAPGTLKAIAYDTAGQPVGEDILQSSGTVAALCIAPEQAKATPGKLLYVNITLTDEKGVRVFSEEKKVDIFVAGGTLLGFGSAAPSTKESYLGTSHTTYNGLVQAVILPDVQAADLCIEASANDLPTASVAISNA